MRHTFALANLPFFVSEQWLSVLALHNLVFLAQNQVAVIRILCHLFHFLEKGHGMSLSWCAHCLWLDRPLRLGEGSI